jgi:hypothetical protein
MEMSNSPLDNSCEIFLATDIRIRSVASIALSSSLQAAMEQEWERALERNPGLFNGEILLLQDWKSDSEGVLRISASWGTYQMFLASRAIPVMRDIVRPLGVSGIMVCEVGSEVETKDGVIFPASALVFARRSSMVATYPNYWELMPSGSISRNTTELNNNSAIDYLHQLLEEFEQETGLNADDSIKQTIPFALIFDKQANIYDICVRLNLTLPQAALAAQFRGNDEYTELKCVSLPDIPRFLQNHLSDIVPTSKVLAEAFIRVAASEVV